MMEFLSAPRFRSPEDTHGFTPFSPQQIEANLKAADLPRSITEHVSTIRRTIGVEKSSRWEAFDQSLPYIDAKNIPHLLGSVVGALVLHQLAKDTNLPDGMLSSLAAELPELPQGIKDSVNTFHERLLFFMKGGDYGDGAVPGLLSTALVGYGLGKGFLPWRGDQWSMEKTWQKKERQQRTDGTWVFPQQGHLVGLGLRDSLLFAEDEDGTSLLRKIRARVDDVLLMQNSGPYWRPNALGLEMNRHQAFANLAELIDPELDVVEQLNYIVTSGLYSANTFLVNGQKGHRLYDIKIVDSGEDGPDSDISFANTANSYARRMREAIFKTCPELETTVIMPMYTQQKSNTPPDPESCRTTARVNFGQDVNVLVPEEAFMNTLLSAMQARGIVGEKVFIDVPNNEAKAQRCKDHLRRVLPDVDEANWITDQNRGGEANASIVLRGRNRDLPGTAEYNCAELGHNFVACPVTSRRDFFPHTNQDPNDQRKVALMYKTNLGKGVLRNIEDKDL